VDWDKLRIFHAVAEAGSFTHAGDALSLSQSAVSRQISALEESLDCVLFHRHARGLIMTEQGELLYRTAHEVLSKLAMVEAKLVEAKDRAKGQLRITASQSFGTLWLTPVLAEFMESYPEIELELILENRELDLSMREADVAIRMAPPRQPELIQRHIISMHLYVYAAPAYLEKYGTPRSIEELDRHRIILYGDEMRLGIRDVNWLAKLSKDQNPPRASLRINSLYAVLKAVEAGMGIATMPEYMQAVSPHLRRILPEIRGPQLDAYFVYPGELRNSKRVQVFRDFLLRKVSEIHVNN
jgi:DNA-binding transcriptional LysR family regulator